MNFAAHCLSRAVSLAESISYCAHYIIARFHGGYISALFAAKETL